VKKKEISYLKNDRLVDIDYILRFYFCEKVSKSKFYRLVRENKFPKPISRGYFENQDGWIFFVQTNNKKHKSYWSQYNLYWHLMRSTKNESNGVELNYTNIMSPPYLI
jgi:predicted DNA-binding transcriptional regulator AlpA